MAILNHSDALTVDLILDRAATVRGDGGVMFAPESGVTGEHVAAVEKILNLLHVMPAPEPSPDLLLRTMERIGTSSTVESIPHDFLPRPSVGQPVA